MLFIHLRIWIMSKRANSRANLGTNITEKTCEWVFCISIYNRRNLHTRTRPSSMASVKTNGKRLCVIGAGPSGTAQLRSFKTLQDQGVAIPQIVCFEKQAELGGSFGFIMRTLVCTKECRIVAPMQKNQTCVSI